MSDIIFNISGGNNQILPNATEANQYICGDQLAEQVLKKSTEKAPLAEAPSSEEEALARFINPANLPTYISRLANCQNTFDVSQVVIDMYQQESRLSKEEIVKKRFITCLLPFITHISQGTSIDNIRVQINNQLENLPHSQRTSR